MEKNNCTLTGHKYDLWESINESQVSRTCKECNHVEVLPKTEETSKEIIKQEEAKKLLTAFLLLEPNEPNIIGYINLMQEDVENYLNNHHKIILYNKISEIYSTLAINQQQNRAR